MNFPFHETQTRCTSRILRHTRRLGRGHSEGTPRGDCTAILHHCTRRRRGVQVSVGLSNVQAIPSISVNNSVLLTVSLTRQDRPDPVRLKSKPPLNAVSVAHALDVYRNRGGNRWSNLRFARQLCWIRYLATKAGLLLPSPGYRLAELHDRSLVTIDHYY